jgi:hypothetical protein
MALDGTVTIAPNTNKKPAIDSLGIYFPILGNKPVNSIIAIKIIIKTPDIKGCGAPPVAEITDSTGPPPNIADAKSAKLLIIDR